MAGSVRLPVDEAMALALACLGRAGLSAEEARVIAEYLVEADLRGYHPLGLARLLHLAPRLAREPREPVRIVREGPAFAQIDGGGNPGVLACDVAITVAMRKAQDSGQAVVVLSRTYMSGVNGLYVRKAALRGLVALMFSHAHPRVAPWGGIDPVLGTNPIAAAFPAGPDPVVVDVGTSATYNGAVEEAIRAGAELPPGVALDADGRPTRDPRVAAAGALLPAGGVKGYALGVLVQLLGILAGGDAVPAAFGNLGYLFLVIDPSTFLPGEEYARRVREFCARARGSRPLPGTEGVMLPGERSERRRQAGLREGICLEADVVEAIRKL